MWKSTGHQIFNRQTIDHLGVLAVYEEGLRAVGDEDEELRHLQLGQVLLPPQVGLHPWPEGRQEVVRVHDDVDAKVDVAGKDLVTSWQPTDVHV